MNRWELWLAKTISLRAKVLFHVADHGPTSFPFAFPIG